MTNTDTLVRGIHNATKLGVVGLILSVNEMRPYLDFRDYVRGLAENYPFVGEHRFVPSVAFEVKVPVTPYYDAVFDYLSAHGTASAVAVQEGFKDDGINFVFKERSTKQARRTQIDKRVPSHQLHQFTGYDKTDRMLGSYMTEDAGWKPAEDMDLNQVRFVWQYVTHRKVVISPLQPAYYSIKFVERWSFDGRREHV